MSKTEAAALADEIAAIPEWKFDAIGSQVTPDLRNRIIAALRALSAPSSDLDSTTSTPPLSAEQRLSSEREARPSVPSDGFDCVYLYENGREVGVINGPQSDSEVQRRAQEWVRSGATAQTGVKPADDTAVNCARFVRWALQEGPWESGDLDGGGVQDKAESLGLIVSVPYNPEKHGAYNNCGCDAGDPWFEFSPGLNAIRDCSISSTDEKSPALDWKLDRPECPRCKGQGRVGVMACNDCGATGVALSSTTLGGEA